MFQLLDKTGLSNSVSKPDGNQGKVVQKPLTAMFWAVLDFNGEFIYEYPAQNISKFHKVQPLEFF